MPVVPIRPQAPSTPVLPPPPDAYLMMAAAQMHSEGRLVQGDVDIPATTRGGTRTDTPAEPPHKYWPSDGRRDKPAMMT